ncbi:unnamed protein product [Symbiodinium natans]|uniref:Uncharacterized protein n=1 Tax=Symbiodinium natans TaxID=878477 RepID=A0A812KIN4_9DINO|nr:unnamed protein product [Symbiodinium natans]
MDEIAEAKGAHPKIEVLSPKRRATKKTKEDVPRFKTGLAANTAAGPAWKSGPSDRSEWLPRNGEEPRAKRAPRAPRAPKEQSTPMPMADVEPASPGLEVPEAPEAPEVPEARGNNKPKEPRQGIEEGSVPPSPVRPTCSSSRSEKAQKWPDAAGDALKSKGPSSERSPRCTENQAGNRAMNVRIMSER